MYDILTQRNLRWAGYVRRVGNEPLPKQILYSKLQAHMEFGRPKLRFKGTVKQNFKSKKVSIGSWQMQSKQRHSWRSAICKGNSQ